MGNDEEEGDVVGVVGVVVIVWKHTSSYCKRGEQNNARPLGWRSFFLLCSLQNYQIGDISKKIC